MKKTFSLIVLLLSGGSLLSQNVGIGTTTPVSKLTVQTPLNATGLTHIGGTNQIIVDESIGAVSASIGTNTNHPFRIKANNSGLLHVYPTGEVIVGSNTTPAFGKFTVETLNNSYGISHLGENGNILATRMGGTSAGIGTFSNTNMRLFCNSQNALLIDAANGNIGIGTDAPAAKLHVAGDTKITGSTNVDLNGNFFGNIGIGANALAGTGLYVNRNLEAIRIDGNQSFLSFYNGANYKGYVWNKGADDMEFGTASVNANGNLLLSIKGTPYLTVQSNGQVSIAGSPTPFGSPAFSVRGNGTLGLANINSEWTVFPNSSVGLPRLSFYGNGFARAYIDENGDWISVSDRSLKENLQAYKPVLAGIKNIQVSTYHFKHNAPDRRSFGLIAQNVAEYFPEIVSPFTDKDGKELLGIAYAKTGVLAIKAIQEQQQIIEQQQQQIESLEKRLAQIEKLLAEKIK